MKMTKAELLKVLVPAIKKHWENCHNRTYSEISIYNAIKGNNKEGLINRYEKMKELGYIK